MKKITFLIALLSSLYSLAQQGLDTIVIDGLSIRTRDWAYLIANVNLNDRDSATYARLRSIREQMLAANPQGWQAFVTVNQLPGRWVVGIYDHIRNLNSGMAEQLDSNTRKNVHAITQLKPWYDRIDAVFPPAYIQERNTGKYILLDGTTQSPASLFADDEPTTRPAEPKKRVLPARQPRQNTKQPVKQKK